MFFDKRGARTSGGRRHRFTVRLRPEALESRELLTGVNLDLSTVATRPIGVQETGFAAGGGAGWSVTDVGDVTGSGFDSFVVGAPSVVRNGTNIVLGNNSPPGTAYLIFGSQGVNLGTINFALLNTQNRIGDLALLNNATQTNPANGNQGFPFAGVKITSENSNSRLGASVVALGDINGDGINDFMVGAPGANDINGGNAGTGRAYIIYGGAALTTAANNSTIDVDNPLTYRTNVVTLVSARPSSRLGASGAGVGDVITDGFNDIAVGAPGATIDGNLNAGAVYLISGTILRNPGFGATFNVDTVGQSNLAGFIPGVIFTGSAPGDQAGFSLGGNVNFDGARTSANQSISDLLIGSPQTGSGSGNAYLIYGGLNLSQYAAIDRSENILRVNLNTVGDPTVTTGAIPGVIFTGAASADLAGYAIASAGDFNGDGIGDILIGAPAANGGTGIAYVIEGAPVSARIIGTIPLNAIPTGVSSVTFRGQGTGDQVGYSLTAVGRINSDLLNEIAIGAPGFNAGFGAVYLIPGSPNLSGVFSLGNVTSATIGGNLITVPSGANGSIGPAALGSSVSGRLTIPGQTRTLDADSLGDLIIGAPGYSLATPGSNPPSSSRNAAGAVFGLEGTFLQLGPAGTGNGTNASITTTIGVNSQSAPFSVDASKTSLLIYVFDTTGFVASTDINPATIVVNGVAYPNATLTAGNGFAIITITPVSALGLTNGTNTITISGTTTAAAGALTFTGSASVTVINASGGGGGGGFVNGSVPIGFQQLTNFPPPNGEHLVPTLDQFKSPAGYQPLPVSVVLGQFQPAPAYVNRRLHGIGGTPAGPQANHNALIVKFGHQRSGLNYAFPKKLTASRHPFKGTGVLTLPARVFTRDIYHPGKAIVVKHKVAVVPRSEQTQIKR
jgi:hypothetical protein